MRKHFILFLFFTILLMPVVLVFLFPNVNTINIENRASLSKPTFPTDTIQDQSLFHKGKTVLKDYNKYASQYTDYYADNFILRNRFISLFNHLKIITKTSPVEQSAIIGSDGWLYLGNNFSNLILENSGLMPLNTQELEKIKSRVLEMKAFCEANGSHFIITLAPDKQTIYNEYYPLNNKKGQSRLEQVSTLLSTLDINYVNVIETLLTNKDKGQLYYKNDSHWTYEGAFYAYEKIFQKAHELVPSITPITFEQIHIVTTMEKIYDISNMLSLDVEEEKNAYYPSYIQVNVIEGGVATQNGNYSYYMNHATSDKESGKVVVFGDSFYSVMYVLTAASSHETFFYQNVGPVIFDKDLIAREHPDVVIYEIVERNIESLAEY